MMIDVSCERFMIKCMLVMLLLCHNALSSCELTVRLEQYSAQSQRIVKTWQGLDVELTQALLSTAGCQYQFIDLPWGRALKLLKSGQIDMMLSVSKTAQRASSIHFIGPQRYETIIFASQPQTPKVMNFESLFKLKKPFAIQRGAFYGSEFHHHLKKYAHLPNKVIYVADNKTKIDLLKANRISGYLEAKLNTLFEKQNIHGFQQLTIHPLLINRAPVYFAFSKKTVSDELVSKLNNAYQVLHKTGKLNTILSKYQVEQ